MDYSFYYRVIELLKEQEAKTGHWIDSAGDDKCSVCGATYGDLYPDYHNTHYCPNCGAKMIEQAVKRMDREKVIKGLEHCKIGDCVGCPYDQIKEESLHGKHDKYVLVCNEQLTEDILALLKEQEEETQNLRRENHNILTQFHEWAKEQEADEPKWTSVKERYPEKEGFYLVSADHGNYQPWIAEMRIFKGVKGFCNGAVMPCVGAWMPLPEPYKEGRRS